MYIEIYYKHYKFLKLFFSHTIGNSLFKKMLSDYQTIYIMYIITTK